MKKLLSLLLLVTIFSITVLSGCTMRKENVESNQSVDVQEEEGSNVIRIASLKGPTSIGMVQLMDEENAQYQFNIYATADEIAALLLTEKVDIANIPANLAAILYRKSNGSIKVLNINTLGVLYMVGSDESIQQFEDAVGRTIYMTGAGTTPEYVLNYLLKQNGLSTEDYHIEYKSEATEVVSALSNNAQALAILPQPYVTVAETQIEGLHTLLNFNEQWEKVSDGSRLITGVTVVRTDFLKEHEQDVQTFMQDLHNSIDYVNENVEEVAASVEKYDIIKEEVAKKAIPSCNLIYLDGSMMKTKLSGYLKTLYEQDPSSVGGAMPGDDFYYETS